MNFESSVQQLESEKVALLCPDLGIYRVTGHKLFNRYMNCELDAQKDRCRFDFGHHHRFVPIDPNDFQLAFAKGHVIDAVLFPGRHVFFPETTPDLVIGIGGFAPRIEPRTCICDSSSRPLSFQDSKCPNASSSGNSMSPARTITEP